MNSFVFKFLKFTTLEAVNSGSGDLTLRQKLFISFLKPPEKPIFFISDILYIFGSYMQRKTCPTALAVKSKVEFYIKISRKVCEIVIRRNECTSSRIIKKQRARVVGITYKGV
ncbi:MAG: hypothetical protein DRJ61_16570 [Acidobacteria bacterium]|nr:MAG: hypothetical protein DRJ61_16570 [Acidobacteriota bacterium]